jgi:hypothetical protein
LRFPIIGEGFAKAITSPDHLNLIEEGKITACPGRPPVEFSWAASGIIGRGGGG